MYKTWCLSVLIYCCSGWDLLPAQTVEQIVNSREDLCNCKGLETAVGDEDIVKKAKESITINWSKLIDNIPPELHDVVKKLETTEHAEGKYSDQLKKLANALDIKAEFNKYFLGKSGTSADEESFETQKYVLACIYVKQKLYEEPPVNTVVDTTTDSVDNPLIITPTINEKIEKIGRMLNLLILGLMILLLLLIFSFLISAMRKRLNPKPVNPSNQAEKSATIPNDQEASNQINKITDSLSRLDEQAKKIIAAYEQKITDLTQKGKIDPGPGKTIIEPETPPVKNTYPTDAKIIYTNHPENGYFTRLSESFEAQKSVYQVIVNKRNPNDGVYTMVDDPETRKYHYNFPDALRQGCNLKGTGNPPLHARINEGRVQRDGDFWKITKKIDLNW